MYLARNLIRGILSFSIRESYQDGDFLKSRDLFVLGPDPARYIIYPGGRVFYIDEIVVDHLTGLGHTVDQCELEELFLPFVQGDIREWLEPSHCRARFEVARRRLAGDSKFQVHSFDKRRFSYLRYGVIDPRQISCLKDRYFKKLVNKSRDEMEQYLLDMEGIMSPAEYKRYVFIAFDLQRFFSGPDSLQRLPLLNQNRVDECFIEELCRLHGDKEFWVGFETEDCLHEYMTRYVAMFFDHEFGGATAWEEYVRNFFDSHREFSYPDNAPVNMDEASDIFGVSRQELADMNREELTRLYRNKAMELHPDQGGDHDSFIALTAAYKSILIRKE